MAEYGSPAIVVGRTEIPVDSTGVSGRVYEVHFDYQLQSGKSDEQLISGVMDETRKKSPDAEFIYIKAENGKGIMQYRAHSPLAPLVALAIACALIIATALVVWFVISKLYEISIVEIPGIGRVSMLHIVLIGGLGILAIYLIRRARGR